MKSVKEVTPSSNRQSS